MERGMGEFFSIFDMLKVMMTATAPIKSMTAKEILEKIHQYLPVREIEKNKFGEVFTPVELIEEMLDQLPKSVWSNPDLKWLDPANGIGNFPLVIYQRLLKGLKKKIPDLETRKEHILNNMLYMVEINPKNVMIARRIFGKKANIFCGSFLDDGWYNKFGVKAFDVIVGNPPYNSPGTKATGNTIWPLFVKKSLDVLGKDKYLVFVHPASWRKPESDKSKTKNMFDMMAHQNQILHLEIYNTTDGLTTFGCGTRYDWYVLKKRTATESTLVKDELGKLHKLNLNDWPFLPNFNFKFIENILTKSSKNMDIIYNRNQFGADKKWVNDKKTTIYKYPLIHSTSKDGPRYFWSSTMVPDVKQIVPMFGVPKVIFGDSGINEVIIDFDGKYGMTQHAIGLKVETLKEAKMLQSVLESDKFKDIIKSMSFSNYQIDWKIFTYFKEDFYKHFLEKPLRKRL
jgi:hypothetical protein